MKAPFPRKNGDWLGLAFTQLGFWKREYPYNEPMCWRISSDGMLQLLCEASSSPSVSSPMTLGPENGWLLYGRPVVEEEGASDEPELLGWPEYPSSVSAGGDQELRKRLALKLRPEGLGRADLIRRIAP